MTKIIKILIVFFFISSTLKAQNLIGIGGAVYQTFTYTSSPVGLSLRFAIKNFYFDVSSNLSNKHFYQINKNISNFPAPNKIRDLKLFNDIKTNICVANIGYMIKLPKIPIIDSTTTIYVIPTIGYGWSQNIYTPAKISFYQKEILFANFGLLFNVKCWKKVNMIFGVGTEERLKFGATITL